MEGSLAKRCLIAISALFVIAAFGYAANAAETAVSAPDKTTSVPASQILAVPTNFITVIPGVTGLHIYTMQGSVIGDTNLTLLHEELNVALKDAGGVFGIFTVPLQYEITGAELTPAFRYRLTMVGAASGSFSFPGLSGPFDVLKTSVPGHTATSMELYATFGVDNSDATPHPVTVGVNAAVAAF